MANIRVDPKKLKSTSGVMEISARSILNAGNALHNATSNLRNYENNYGGKIRAIGLSAQNAAGSHHTRTVSLANNLSLRANRFLAADTASSTSFSGIVDYSIRGDLSGIWWGFKDLFGKKKVYSFEEIWDFLKGTKSGKELLEQLEDNGLTMVLPDGTRVGAENGKEIEIIIRDPSDTDSSDSWLGFYNGRSVTLNQEYFLLAVARPDMLAGVLAHEMQHALDDQQGILHNQLLIFHKTQSTNSIEKTLEADIEDRVLSEARAHARGAEVDREFNDNWGEAICDTDNVLTTAEKKFVLETRNYAESVYEEQYERILENALGKEVVVDVYVDSQGEIQAEVHALSDGLFTIQEMERQTGRHA